MTRPTTPTTPLSAILRPPSSTAYDTRNSGSGANFTSILTTALNSSMEVVLAGGGHYNDDNNVGGVGGTGGSGGVVFGVGVTIGEELSAAAAAAAAGLKNNASSTPAASLPHPQHYESLYHGVAVALSAIVFTVGFVGNVLVVIVIARTRSMHTTTNCYLLSLAVADCLVLLAATLPAVPETFFRVDEWPFGRALCSILIYVQYVGVDASSFSITAFTIERYIAICHPMRAQTMCTVSRAKKIIGGLWIFTVLYCGPWLGLTDLRVLLLSDGSTITKCVFRLERSSYLVLYMFDLVVFYVLPFFISTVLYCLIGRILVMTSLRHSRDLPTRTPLERRSGPPPEKKPVTHQVSGSKRRSDSRVQVIRMLVVVVLVFATLWMPYRVMVVYNSFAQHKFMDLWFLMFSRTLIYINCAINPILYNVMSVKFRRAFKNLLCCEKAIRGPNSTRPFHAKDVKKGLRPAGPPVFLYSEVATEGTNVKRHTFSSRRHSNSYMPKKEMSPFLCSAHHSSPGHRQQGQSQIQGRQGHPLKVILLEWVKGSDKVKVQTSNQACYGSHHQREKGWPRRKAGKEEEKGEEGRGGGDTRDNGALVLTVDRSPSLQEKKAKELCSGSGERPGDPDGASMLLKTKTDDDDNEGAGVSSVAKQHDVTATSNSVGVTSSNHRNVVVPVVRSDDVKSVVAAAASAASRDDVIKSIVTHGDVMVCVPVYGCDENIADGETTC